MINSVTVGFFMPPEILRVGFFMDFPKTGVFNGGVLYVNPYRHIPSGLILWGLIKDWQLNINRNEHYSKDINRLVGN